MTGANRARGRAARSLGIDLYVIGIGSDAEVDIDFVDPRTGEAHHATLRGGFDEASLKALAESGGGHYYYAGSNTALQAVFDSIDAVERVEQRSLLRVMREPLDRAFIFIGLCLVLFDFLIRRFVAREVM